MTRQTSIEAYNEIKESGLLSVRRMQVYDVLFHHGPMTALQIVTHFGRRDKRFQNSGNLAARLSELRNSGVVQELGTTQCPISGRKVILWDVTDRLPLKLERAKKTPCKHCHGKGYFIEQQMKMF